MDTHPDQQSTLGPQEDPTMSQSSSDDSLDDIFYAPLIHSEGYYSELLYASSSASNSPAPSNQPTSLHWFRLSCLRLHDNPALLTSLQQAGTNFRGIFILDPWFTSGEHKFGVNRWRFLLECLHDLDQQLRALGQDLCVVKGPTAVVLSQVCAEWNVSHITYQVSPEPHSKIEEGTVDQMARDLNIKVEKFYSHTLFEPSYILSLSDSKRIMTTKEFKAIIPKLGNPPEPLPAPTAKSLAVEDNYFQHSSVQHRIPTLADLGFSGASLYTNHWVGGEREALSRLPVYINSRRHLPANLVDLLFDKSSLSPYVRFGCVSVRRLWQYIWDEAHKDSTLHRLARELSQKLLQREFYILVSTQVPNFDSLEDNPVCLPLPWHSDNELLQLWQNGQTGYPWIDAGIRQMHQEGWTHYIIRESLAAFLTRGDLWLSWEHGKDTFDTYMLDFEPSVSCACWMHSSCSAFLTGPVEHYCPISYGQKIDPEGKYIRTYLPELSKFPKEYIYCPWKAPLEVQQKCGCIIGQDYPNPIIDHMTAGIICVERLKSTFSALHSSSLTTTH